MCNNAPPTVCLCIYTLWTMQSMLWTELLETIITKREPRYTQKQKHGRFSTNMLNMRNIMTVFIFFCNKKIVSEFEKIYGSSLRYKHVKYIGYKESVIRDSSLFLPSDLFSVSQCT